MWWEVHDLNPSYFSCGWEIGLTSRKTLKFLFWNGNLLTVATEQNIGSSSEFFPSLATACCRKDKTSVSQLRFHPWFRSFSTSSWITKTACWTLDCQQQHIVTIFQSPKLSQIKVEWLMLILFIGDRAELGLNSTGNPFSFLCFW